MGVSGQRHAPAALLPRGKDPSTHCTGDWVGLRAGLDIEVRGKIIRPCRGSNPDRPAVQSVRHYTDWATPAPDFTWTTTQNICSCVWICSVACKHFLFPRLYAFISSFVSLFLFSFSLSYSSCINQICVCYGGMTDRSTQPAQCVVLWGRKREKNVIPRVRTGLFHVHRSWNI
jgi:hypothetical protein